MTTYKHRYITPTEYQVVEVHDNGFTRVVDPHNEEEWVKAGNTPQKESGDRFILIDGDRVIEDPNKDAILAAESAAIKAQEDKVLAITAAKEKIALMSADVDKVDSIDGLKLIIQDLIKQVKVLTG